MSVCSKKSCRGEENGFFLDFIKIYAIFFDVSEKNQNSRKMKWIYEGGPILINFGTHFLQI